MRKKRGEDMKHAARLGAKLITSNEPAFMIAELEKAGLRGKESSYDKGICV